MFLQKIIFRYLMCWVLQGLYDIIHIKSHMQYEMLLPITSLSSCILMFPQSQSFYPSAIMLLSWYQKIMIKNNFLNLILLKYKAISVAPKILFSRLKISFSPSNTHHMQWCFVGQLLHFCSPEDVLLHLQPIKVWHQKQTIIFQVYLKQNRLGLSSLSLIPY